MEYQGCTELRPPHYINLKMTSSEDCIPQFASSLVWEQSSLVEELVFVPDLILRAELDGSCVWSILCLHPICSSKGSSIASSKASCEEVVARAPHTAIQWQYSWQVERDQSKVVLDISRASRCRRSPTMGHLMLWALWSLQDSDHARWVGGRCHPLRSEVFWSTSGLGSGGVLLILCQVVQTS